MIWEKFASPVFYVSAISCIIAAFIGLIFLPLKLNNEEVSLEA